jgi:hypothetical protein
MVRRRLLVSFISCRCDGERFRPHPRRGEVYTTTTGRNVGLGGQIYVLGPGRVSIGVGFPSGTSAGPLNEWTWKVSGKLLTVKRVRDPNPDRAAFFAGVWKKIA